MINIWENALSSMQEKMSVHNFNLWIRPLQFVSYEGNSLVVKAPNKYVKEWFEDNYLQSIENDLISHLGDQIRLLVLVEEDNSDTLSLSNNFDSISNVDTSVLRPRTALNDRYLFSNFVVGPSNQIAQAAAKLVAEVPGKKYNPLFIYGGTGLGKTHLIQAIGHSIQERNPNWSVLYLTSERFVNDFVNSIRLVKMDEYRERYRNHCDVLLVDDIQFLSGKDRTQEEFFHTFNTLHEKQKQIVITSDKFPNQMPELEDRLKSRFQWGLIVDILFPELETRVAILKKKAELDGIVLPNDVAQFLALTVKSNVRELEGALIRLAAFSSLNGCAISVEFAEQILKSVLKKNRSQITIDRIQREICNYFNIKIKDIKSPRRPRAISYPRQIAMYLCRKLTSSSLSEIGEQFGGKDHTTVLNADRKIQRLLSEDDQTRSTVEILERIFSSIS